MKKCPYYRAAVTAARLLIYMVANLSFSYQIFASEAYNPYIMSVNKPDYNCLYNTNLLACVVRLRLLGHTKPQKVHTFIDLNLLNY